MKTLSTRVRLVLLALMALSLNAVVSAGTFSAQTLFGNSTANPKAGSLNLLQQLTLPVVVGQMEQACPAIPELSIPAYNWWRRNQWLPGARRLFRNPATLGG
jgi:hypothetical protein